MENNYGRKQGSALIYVIMVFAVIAVLAMGAVYLASSNTSMTKMEVFQQQAYYTAKSNLDQFISSVEKTALQPSYIELMKKLLVTKQATSTIDVGDNVGTTTINLTCQEDDGNYCVRAKVESAGTYKGYSQTVSGFLNLTYSGGDMFFASSIKDEHHTNIKNAVYFDGATPTLIDKLKLPVYKPLFLRPPNDPWGNLKYVERNKLLIKVIEKIMTDNNESFQNMPACKKDDTNDRSCTMMNTKDNYVFDTSKNNLVVKIPSSLYFTGNISFTENSKHKVWLFDDSGGQSTIGALFGSTSFSPLPSGEAGVVFVTLAKGYNTRFELGSRNPGTVDYHLFVVAPNTYVWFNNADIYGGVIGETVNHGFDNIGDVYLQTFSDNKYLQEIYDIIIGVEAGGSGESVAKVEASYE